VTVIVMALTALVAYRSRAPTDVDEPPPNEAAMTAGPHPYSLVVDPTTLRSLERRGFSLDSVLPKRAYLGVVAMLETDLAELARRPGIGGETALNHSFDARWLRDPDARFELVGLVPRLDRAFAEPGSCGELRRVYRLALTRKGRPTTRLPMTVSVLSFIPADACRAVAGELVALPTAGRPRADALARVYRSPPQRVEINLQNLHGTATPQDNEDHAEYLLRSFDIAPEGSVSVHPLLATPREDLSPVEKSRLTEYLRAHFDDIDKGTLVLPPDLLATRAISVSPRGLARERNRVFYNLFGADAETRFAHLPYASARIARSPRALLRRLDQGTCQGCHQSRAVAGFHLLGEERDAHRAFNALRVGISNHLAAELPWREAMIEGIAAGREYDVMRPFAERGADKGAYGARCGRGDPGFAAYTCEPGLECKDDRGDELGACLPADGPHEGDACEPATVTTGLGASGDHLSPLPSITCRVGGHVIVRDGCLGNSLGFPGGTCTDRCTEVGALTANGDAICAKLPVSGYEEICFRTDEPIERCLATRMNPSLVRACDADHPCRDDYACARVSAEATRGACVPPYFVFQARVDGPRADR
jgi:hypothetical protein